MKCQIFIILVVASAALGQFYGRRIRPTTTTEAWPQAQTDPTPGNRQTDGPGETDPWPQDQDPWPQDPQDPEIQDPTTTEGPEPWQQPNRPQRRPQRPVNRRPTGRPTRRPNGRPTRRPNGRPTRRPNGRPTRRPNGRPTRRPNRRPNRRPVRTTTPSSSTDPWSADTTTRPSTDRQGDGLCQGMIVGAGCQDFYGCFLTSQTACSLERDEPQSLRDIAGFCLISENVEDDNQFDNTGRDYIAKYRVCVQERILPTVDSDSCDVIEDKADEILVTDDLIWDCLYQNNTLCDVVESSRNSEALAAVFGGSGRVNQRIYRQLMKRVSEQCLPSVSRQFAEDFGEAFLSNMMNNMPGMMMMMGGNGGD